ncbi:MAG: sigma-54-dependent Fis family transcriptional regulator [Nitrospinota bacterium]|nr:MAG: sigma-54-dependent Fis family transcriptional regulator [Nitrospinota bacterium]
MAVTVLIVEDDENTRKSLGMALEEDGYLVRLASSAEAALKVLQEEIVDAVITDIVMGKMSGMDLLDYIFHNKIDTVVIVVTGYGTIESAVEAMRKGAYDYITKPIDIEKLSLLIQKGVASQQLVLENKALKQQLRDRFSLTNIVGKSPAVQRLLYQIEQVAATDVTVLIRGESGTGKELIAEAIHYNSLRADKPLIKVNCGIFAEGVVESELFGHERGAFTGAVRQKKGRFELADQGTLFLDEVGELTPSVQVKLLRVLQDQVFERVGGTASIAVDVRLLAATNKDLEREVAEGRFREDLYYRLNVVSVEVPPLRDRVEDIPLLADYFLEVLNRKYQKQVTGLSREALQCLLHYPWPGNVRELRNCLESLVVMAKRGRIEVEDLPSHIRGDPGLQKIRFSPGTSLQEIEKEAILRTLHLVGGNKTKAAQLLGIGVKTLYRRLKEYQIE